MPDYAEGRTPPPRWCRIGRIGKMSMVYLGQDGKPHPIEGLTRKAQLRLIETGQVWHLELPPEGELTEWELGEEE
jgi:hypothetical protein